MTDLQAGTSPLVARSNPIIYAAIGIAFIIVAIFAVIYIIQMLKKKKEETPEFIEAEKNRPTTLKDIQKLSNYYNFSKEDVALLWEICKKYEVINVYFSSKQFNELDPIFRQAYNDLKFSADEAKINRLFIIKFRLDKIYAESINISSTNLIQEKTKIELILKNGEKIKTELFENTKNFLALSISDEIYNSDSKPEPLEKILFTFVSPTGLRYAFLSRVIRYQEKNDVKLIIVSHSTNLVKKIQRSFKRKNVNEKCRFSAVKTETSKNGEIQYIPSEQKIPGILSNISGGGCCIISKLPIKQKQLIYTEFDLYDGTYPAIGEIVKTRRNEKNNTYNLHIHFIKISLNVQNKLLAKVYSYE